MDEKQPLRRPLAVGTCDVLCEIVCTNMDSETFDAASKPSNPMKCRSYYLSGVTRKILAHGKKGLFRWS